MGITSIRLQADLEQPLSELADKKNRSKNWLINHAIKELIEKEKLEATRWAETLQALESVKAGDIVDGDKVHDWLESWGTPSEKAQPK